MKTSCFGFSQTGGYWSGVYDEICASMFRAGNAKQLPIMTLYISPAIHFLLEISSIIRSEIEANNCFSITAQVIIRATFSFLLFVSYSETLKTRVATILKISASLSLSPRVGCL